MTLSKKAYNEELIFPDVYIPMVKFHWYFYHFIDILILKTIK